MSNSRAIDMQGKRFSELTAIRRTVKCSSGDFKWEFLCNCGNLFESNGYAVRSGKVKSCPKCAQERSRLASIKHGKSETKEFEIWTGMHTRCYNSSRKEFKNYGARGIKICARWRESFESFLVDMGPRPSPSHSVERKNNDGDYEPDNCYWATVAEQANNRRSNHPITIDGVTKNMSEWAAGAGLSPSALMLREKAGISGAELLRPSSRGGLISFNGERNTHAGWSKKTGIKQSTIAMRITKYKWSVERALTTGAKF